MDKLELDLEDLTVNSFTAAPEQDEGEGTVKGNDHSCHYNDTCDISCGGTCRICEPTNIENCDETHAPDCTELACVQ